MSVLEALQPSADRKNSQIKEGIFFFLQREWVVQKKKKCRSTAKRNYVDVNTMSQKSK